MQIATLTHSFILFMYMYVPPDQVSNFQIRIFWGHTKATGQSNKKAQRSNSGKECPEG